MKLTAADLPKLRNAALLALAMLAAGAGSAYLARTAADEAQREFATTRAERNDIDGRLKRVRSEEQEIKRKSALFAELQARGVIGDERRLEWAEQLRAIRERRRLPALDFEIAPQALLEAEPGGYSFQSSSMKLSARLLHEEDLLRLLADLRQDARALVLPRACSLARLPRGTPETTATAHLQAECQIDWVTLRGPAASL
mgnify:CR=1 FL=1